jgi:hypothetical protein
MMTRLASAVSLAFLLSAAACSSDKKTTTPDTGVTVSDGGPADTASADTAAPDTASADTGPAMCVGSFSTISRTTLGAATAPTGGCAASADLDLICSINVADITAACGVACATTMGGATCVPTCVKAKAALTDACIGCYAQAVQCAQVNCLAVCLSDSKGMPCTQCQIDHGCRAAFFTCSGLPGGSPAPDGGATDTAATDTAATDTAASDTAASDTAATDTAATDTAATDTAVSTDSATD